jgi:uncharacterized membrane protein (DUF4010 family)
MRRWFRTGYSRIWIRSLGALVCITLTGYLLDVILRSEGMPRNDLLLISDFLIGFVAATVVYKLAVHADKESRFLAVRLRVIAEMNHHIRNALQVIAFHTQLPEQHKIAEIDEAVNRITWALRELLPKMTDANASSNRRA